MKIVDDISALGLRHVGGWSLSLVLKMLMRTITEDFTIVMKAVNDNNVKYLDDTSALGLRHAGYDILVLMVCGMLATTSPLSTCPPL